MKNNSKSKKSKIPLCPTKNILIKKNINKIIPFLNHWRQPSTPSSISSKNIKINNSFSIIDNNKYINNKNLSNSSLKRSPFHAFIPRNKSHSENNIKKQKIILIKKINTGDKLSFNFNNIKEYIIKKKEKNNDRNINKKEKDNSDLNNSHGMNNTKANTNSNTTIGISPIFSDRNLKEENNKLNQIPKNSRNPLEFTFGDNNFFQNQIQYDTKTLIKNNSFDVATISQLSIDKNNIFQSVNGNKYNYDKNNLTKNTINNIRVIKQKIIINNKKRKEKNSDSLNYNYKNFKSFSIEKDNKIKNNNNNRISKSITFHNWPKLNYHNNINNFEEFHKTPKISKQILNLIPVDKKYNLSKKYKLIIKNQFENNKRNSDFMLNISTKNKENKNNSYKFFNQYSNSTLTKTNKSSPKLFLKHPSLKNLFD